MFEEAFYLAAQHERISAVTRLYSPPFRTLAKVHDKGSFQELCDRLEIPTPRTVLAHSGEELREAIRRFPGSSPGRRSRAGESDCSPTPGRWPPLAGRLPSDRGESLAGPGVRGWADVLHLLGASRRPGGVPHGLPGAAAVGALDWDPVPLRRSVGHARNRRAARPELSWDGQMSLDFIETDEALVMIECNPRPTDGVLPMTPEELERGLLGPEEETPSFRPGGRSNSTSRSSVRSSGSRSRSCPGQSTIWRSSRDGSRVAGRNA